MSDETKARLRCSAWLGVVAYFGAAGVFFATRGEWVWVAIEAVTVAYSVEKAWSAWEALRARWRIP